MAPTTTSTGTLAAGVTTTGTTLFSSYSRSRRRLSHLHSRLNQSSRSGCSNYKFHFGAKHIYLTLPLPPCVTNRVTPVPVDDFDTPVPDFDPRGDIARLKVLRSRLQTANSLQEKIRVLDSDSRVRTLFGRGGRGEFPARILVGLEMWEMFLVKCLVAAGQGHVVGLEVGMEVYSDGSGSESSGLKTALRALAGMVEKWGLSENVNGMGVEAEDLKELLRILGEVEQFYDCIGGVIG